MGEIGTRVKCHGDKLIELNGDGTSEICILVLAAFIAWDKYLPTDEDSCHVSNLYFNLRGRSQTNSRDNGRRLGERTT